MTRRSVEVSTLVPCLVPARFDCLGIVGFVELGCAHLVHLVCFVHLVDLVHLVSFVQPNKQDKSNKPNNDLRMLADFFSILLEVRGILACGCVPLKAKWWTDIT